MSVNVVDRQSVIGLGNFWKVATVRYLTAQPKYASLSVKMST